MLFSQLEIVDYVLLGALGVLFIAQVYWYARYMCAPARKLRRDKKKNEEMVNDPYGEADRSNRKEMDSVPGVTVVLAAHNESYNLSQYLQALLTQDYPKYEVIVVDDGSEDNTRDIVESYITHDPRLHLTFVPYGARVGSTKKLALTLAAKAAQYDYLLLTDADCVPESDQWIREMMAGFSNSPKDGLTSNSASGLTSIILGFSPYFEEQGHINRLVRFDTLFNGLHYLGAALCGHPYMGVGRNLAYRKSLFFESGGFTHQMTSRAGDDDLFVNHVATKQNTAVVLSRNSYMWSLSKKTMKEWWQQKRRHLSVSYAYKPSTQFRLTLEPLTRGLFYALVLGIVVYQGINNFQLSTFNFQLLIPLLAAVGLFFLRWIIQTLVLNVSARRMGLKRFNMFSILWFDIALPLVNLYMLIVPKKYKW
jgi:cellulose synthase/poly-beta-1,6-N-acetylglucosamine synthase-like glycosyltransferase